MVTGTGTVLNVATVLTGSAVGVALGHRLPERTRHLVTDALGLVTLLIAALSAAAVRDVEFSDAVGSGAPVLIVLGSLLIGGIAGSLLDLEGKLEAAGVLLRRRLSRRVGVRDTAAPAASPTATATDEAAPQRDRFVEGFVTASLVFCVGPLTVLGSLSDGLGRGIEQLALKSTLDGFAAIAFAASLGWGVAASALAVGVVQGGFTVVGVVAGDVLPESHVAALTAVGGLVLVGVGLRLLRIRSLAVADLLPALLVAPLLTEVVARLR